MNNETLQSIPTSQVRLLEPLNKVEPSAPTNQERLMQLFDKMVYWVQKHPDTQFEGPEDMQTKEGSKAYKNMSLDSQGVRFELRGTQSHRVIFHSETQQATLTIKTPDGIEIEIDAFRNLTKPHQRAQASIGAVDNGRADNVLLKYQSEGTTRTGEMNAYTQLFSELNGAGGDSRNKVIEDVLHQLSVISQAFSI